MAVPRLQRRLISAAASLFLLGGSPFTRAATPTSPRALIVTATTDLKGKTSPCGCHIPRGGFARMAAFLDSTRAVGVPLLFVDAGGSFPDVEGRTDLAEFMFQSLVALRVDAMGVAPRDLRHGLAFLRDQIRRTNAPVVCANLLDRAHRVPVFPTSRIVETGGVRVGIFALVGGRFDLGPASDSLFVDDPENAATREVAALRARGATVIVLLSQLGRVGGEDVMSAVLGIDALILGHDIPIIEHGRRIGDGVASYAGDQGQQLGVVTLTLGTDGHASDQSSEVRSLGPDVSEQPQMLASVRAFEDAYNERMRAEQRRVIATASADPDNDPVDHFVGQAVCARCHAAEAEQWATTAHSLAWDTLVRERKDATPECIPCHAVGYQQPGGFQDVARTPHLVNVQCENCHGMGTLHSENQLVRNPIGETTCKTCHNQERDPEFDFAAKFPLIVHGNSSGESIRIIKSRRTQQSPRSTR
jgi:2',3'-cyclic-nucleotide 2'-phosphodiesterase (5'-nucleotidase family)